jgi:hypothetical protein
MAGFNMMRVASGRLHVTPHAQVDGAAHAHHRQRTKDQDKE